MTVEILRLSGADDGDAVGALLDDYRAHPDLSRLLVIDDTAALFDHLAVYERLLTSRRLDHLLCVAVGPRPADSGEFRFPANISGAQGSAVIWVGDRDGIDSRLAASAVAVGHTGNSESGLHHLVGLLSVDEVFDRVCEIARNVPGGVMSPGLRLTGTEDEGARFAAALVLAIQRLTAADPVSAARADEPFTVLLAAPAGPVGLAEHGELSRYRQHVIDSAALASDALPRYAGIDGLLSRDRSGVYGQVRETAAALGAFRDLAARLLTDANTQGELTETQRGLLTAAGVRLPELPEAAAGAGECLAGDGPIPPSDPEGSAVSKTIAGAILGGDTLPQIVRRLNLTASALAHPGSASYLPGLDEICPAALVDRLTGAPPPPLASRWLPWTGALPVVLGVLVGTWKPAAGAVVGLLALLAVVAVVVSSWHTRVTAWQRELRLDEAPQAADEVARLVSTVAAREWCGGNATPAEVTRVRIAILAVSDELARHAEAAHPGTRTARTAQLSEALLPGLCDLVLAAVQAGIAPANAGGEAVSARAQAKAAQLLGQWQEDVRTGGALVRPRFATSDTGNLGYAGEDEVAAIAAAILHDPREVMWQLCAPADLGALDMAAAPQLMALAPRFTRQRLAEMLPRDTIWTSSGEQAGLLRLVPLHAGIICPVWTADEQH